MTVMLPLPSPSKLMLGYLLGAYVTSITLGVVIVFSLSNSSATNTTQNTLSPAVESRSWRSRWSLLGLSGAGAKNVLESAGVSAVRQTPTRVRRGASGS